MDITKLPLVCTATLHSLEESLNGERILCRYIDMWPARFERLREALQNGRHEDAMDSANRSTARNLVKDSATTADVVSLLTKPLAPNPQPYQGWSGGMDNLRPGANLTYSLDPSDMGNW